MAERFRGKGLSPMPLSSTEPSGSSIGSDDDAWLRSAEEALITQLEA